MNDPSRRDDPERLRDDIARTRADLGRTVTQIEYRVSPRVVARRQVRKVQDGVGRARTAVMGSPEYDTARSRPSGQFDREIDIRDQASEKAGQAREQASQYADQARETVQEAPERVKEATAGNPLAAGLIAFGVGALAGTLLPSSETERQAAQKLRDEFEEPLREEGQRAGERVRDRVQTRAQDATEQVKATAQDATERTKQEAQSSAQEVQEHAKSAGEDVRQS